MDIAVMKQIMKVAHMMEVIVVDQTSIHNFALNVYAIKGLSIYDSLLMISGLHQFGCFFIPPIFESYKVV